MSIGDLNVLRLLDANLNRAREGLRVLEDYARFVRDDRPVGEALKSIRHRLTLATQTIADEAIAHRDVGGDVGTSYTLDTTAPRESLRDIVIAAGKRTGEALRSIEEYLKTIDAPAARAVEQTRYAFYDVEQAIARTFAPPDERLANMRLYVIITEAHCAGRPWDQVAKAALEGGADVLQLREKSLESGELLDRAKSLVAMCRAHNAISIINDRPDIALLSGADGVHIGQGDLPARAARQILGAGKIVGVSTHELAHARQAVLDGADYLGVGPIFKSTTKPRDFVSGLDYARAVASEIRIPLVGIAGITLENIAEVTATGLKAIAVTSAVCASHDVAETARSMKRLLTATP